MVGSGSCTPAGSAIGLGRGQARSRSTSRSTWPTARKRSSVHGPGRTEDRLGVSWRSSPIPASCALASRDTRACESPPAYVRIENRTPWDEPGRRATGRSERRALVARVLSRAPDGSSFIDPPSRAAAAIRGCHPVRSFRARGGDGRSGPGRARSSSTTIPDRSGESQNCSTARRSTRSHDAYAHDSRTRKRPKRARWDPRVAALLDRADGLGRSRWRRCTARSAMCGTGRWCARRERRGTIGRGARCRDRPGARVTLRPHKGTDAQEPAVRRHVGDGGGRRSADVGGEPHLLVTIDGDSAADAPIVGRALPLLPTRRSRAPS
jgi:hypothetical protein